MHSRFYRYITINYHEIVSSLITSPVVIFLSLLQLHCPSRDCSKSQRFTLFENRASACAVQTSTPGGQWDNYPIMLLWLNKVRYGEISQYLTTVRLPPPRYIGDHYPNIRQYDSCLSFFIHIDSSKA